jgi:hypothetical protein
MVAAVVAAPDSKKSELEGTIMKTLTAFLVAAVSAAVLFSVPASAEEEVSRAQVLADLAQARANGEVPNYGMDAAYNPVQIKQAAGKSRAEVRAELRDARQDGTLEALNADRAVPAAKTAAQTRLADTKAKTTVTAE